MVTVTWVTPFACLGASTVSEKVVDFTTLALVLANRTTGVPRVGSKFAPVIVMRAPPTVEAILGEIEETTGWLE